MSGGDLVVAGVIILLVILAVATPIVCISFAYAQNL